MLRFNVEEEVVVIHNGWTPKKKRRRRMVVIVKFWSVSIIIKHEVVLKSCIFIGLFMFANGHLINILCILLYIIYVVICAHVMCKYIY